jgi:fibronectin type 3 domain-containing protein
MSWSPSNSAVIGYNAYSSEQTGGPYTEMNSAPVAATVYNDTAVQAGITYYFVVTAVNSNNVESVNSGEASVQVP